MLNLQWPRTFVMNNPRGDEEAQRTHKATHGYLFTIHGLWPQLNGYGPTHCNHTETFDLRTVEAIPNIWRYWTSFAMRTPNFWNYEWQKHGTCAANLEKLSTLKAYFQFSVDRAMEFDQNVYQRLGDDFSPSNNKSISAGRFKNSIENLHAYRVDLRCRYGRISDIRLCYDLELRPIDCEKSSNCFGEVILPA